MKERGELTRDKIVTTVMSNMGLLEALRKKGISYEITPVGDKYVSQCMKENGYSLGGEDSGHIIFSKHAVTGDGILTALKLMETMLEKKAKLSSLSDEMFVYPSVLLNVRVKEKGAARADEGVKAAEEQAQQMLGWDGRLLLRESGTEPVVRILAEAKTKALCDGAVETVRSALETGGHIINS
jgi:phosphoglucosamine mutase